MEDKIYIISGTNREEAVSLAVSHIYKNEFKLLGMEAEIIDLRDLPDNYLAAALYENAGTHQGMVDMRQKMKEGQKFLFVVPEYNGSFPGVLKAFIDGLKFPETFTNKKCALVGVSSGVQGGALALSHLTDILNYCGTHVLARKVRLAEIGKNMKEGLITNKLYNQLINWQINEFLEF
ncbi:MAG: NAD(P)H-dependent oxidoreductase [Cyclobacteriaceae bacterium]|nr:NAD(P)H-dependent oxidoreductase [Cyclobacteriaceae bacterium]